MKLEGVVGPQILSDGVSNDIRLSRLGELIVTELHGKYYEQSVRGNVFHTCMTAGIIFPGVAATTSNVMSLYNPTGSGKNVSLISFDMVATTINGTLVTGAYALVASASTSQAAITGTAMTVTSALIGSAVGNVAKPLSTSTIPASPTIFWPFAQKVTGGAATAIPIIGIPSFHIDFDGMAILSPGTAITPQIIGTVDTTNLTVICAFRWEEVTI